MQSAVTEQRRLRVLMEAIEPVSVNRQTNGPVNGLTLRVRPAINLGLAVAAQKADLESLASLVAGTHVTIEVEALSPAPKDSQDNALTMETATEHSLIKQAVELFGGRVIRVQPRPRSE